MMKKSKTEIGKLVRKARRDREISIINAAKMIGIAPSHLHAIETGKKPRPKMQTLYKLSYFYGLSIDEVCCAAYRIPVDVFDVVARSTAVMKLLRNTDLLDHPEKMRISFKDEE